ncbi:MAG TPA: anhydro-N-acetylmuramic acid kinase [Terriglobales bacterium]|jgi:anhydro-N-acetylmuramic acid kinase|nr:anhydro-N-acetylmuramic acid kinase [Terriglobales bacterium]
MIVAGVMSGTSADGINVALVRLNSSPSRARTPSLHYLAHAEYPYPKQVRRAVLAAMNATRASVADLARLNFLLAELYADAVLASQRRFHLKAELVGCHGQTLYHQGEAAAFMGRKLTVTWQTGEGAILAARVGVPVVSDFRPADMAAGGKGAPLVPFLDFLLYRDSRVGRVVQNIGGIANFTAIPAGASADRVIAFDTGPGNMVIDAVMQRLFGKPYDRDGKIAGSGTPLDDVINDILRAPFFRRKPPKTAGREEFGREFTLEFIRRCGGADKRDIVATATALTSRSIADALRRFVVRRTSTYRDFIVSGGGANNPILIAMLANELRPIGLRIRSSDEFGLPSEAKEAAAFALLAFQTWNRRTSNLPSATGAKRPAILGKISYA